MALTKLHEQLNVLCRTNHTGERLFSILAKQIWTEFNIPNIEITSHEIDEDPAVIYMYKHLESR